MGDNAEHRDGPQSGSFGDDSAGVNDPNTQTAVKPSRAEFSARVPA